MTDPGKKYTGGLNVPAFNQKKGIIKGPADTVLDHARSAGEIIDGVINGHRLGLR